MQTLASSYDALKVKDGPTDKWIGAVSPASVRTSKAFGASWLPRFLYLAVFVLACLSLPQRAAGVGATAFAVKLDTPVPEASSLARTASDDMVLISLTSSMSMAAEDGLFTFTVKLSEAAGAPVDITWTATDGTATVGSDLQRSSGTVSFAPGDLEATFTIRPIDDLVEEENETFTVTISAAPGVDLPEGVMIDDDNKSATVMITAGDAVDPLAGRSVSIADAAPVMEGGTAAFTLVMTRAVADGDVEFNVAYAGMANPATDLGANPPATVTIDANATEATLSVPIAVDDLAEGDETFTVSITVENQPENTVVGIGDGQATGTITDDDEATISLTPAMPMAAEGELITFTVSLSAATSAEIDLVWTAISGTATVDEDLEMSMNTMKIAPGTREAMFTIMPKDDDIVEDDETFTVVISATGTLPGVSFSQTSRSSTATITDDDEARISLDLAEPTMAENEMFTYTVTLDAAVGAPVDIIWTATDGTATVQEDLKSSTGTVEIMVGDMEVTFTIEPEDDEVVEGDETFTVTISETSTLPERVMIDVDNKSSTATITDDDEALVSLAPAMLTAAENEMFTYTVNLDAAVGAPVDIIWTATDGTATVQEDLKSSTGTVEIMVGDMEVTFTIEPEDDEDIEGDETFMVTISGTSALLEGVMIDDDNRNSTATITDNDEALVSLTPAMLTAAENGSFDYTVSLNAPVDALVGITWTATDGTATVSKDLKRELYTKVLKPE